MGENSRLITAAVDAVTLTLENMVFEQPQLVQSSLIPFPHRQAQDTRKTLGVRSPSQSEENAADIGHVWAVIPILTPYYGKMSIELAESFARDLAQNLYCGDECNTGEVFLDVLAEILNTMAGRFMISLLGTASDFELGFPSTGRGRCDELIPPALENSDPVEFGHTGNPRFVRLKFDISGQLLELSISGEDFVAMNEEMPTIMETTQ